MPAGNTRRCHTVLDNPNRLWYRNHLQISKWHETYSKASSSRNSNQRWREKSGDGCQTAACSFVQLGPTWEGPIGISNLISLSFFSFPAHYHLAKPKWNRSKGEPIDVILLADQQHPGALSRVKKGRVRKWKLCSSQLLSTITDRILLLIQPKIKLTSLSSHVMLPVLPIIVSALISILFIYAASNTYLYIVHLCRNYLVFPLGLSTILFIISLFYYKSIFPQWRNPFEFWSFPCKLISFAHLLNIL